MMVLTIGGRLGANATLGNANGTPVVNFSVACDGWDPKLREKVTTWVRVAQFGARAERLAEHLAKGTSVMCTGECRLSEYKGRQNLEMTATSVALMGASRSQAGGSPGTRDQRDEREVARRIAWLREKPADVDDDEAPF